jgi:hypothetical protein
MNVLILAKTKFGKQVCVGGIVLNNNQFVRLLSPGGWYQSADTKFEIGQVWDIDFSPSSVIREPHTEDVIVHSKKYIKSIKNIPDLIINSGVNIWRGSIDNIFDGKLQWAKSGTGFLSANSSDLPSQSVGFWINDKPLLFEYQDEHYLYPIETAFTRRAIKYKGIPSPIDTIPVNTLLRVSLAKWFRPKPDIEERCYAQISGWYE